MIVSLPTHARTLLSPVQVCQKERLRPSHRRARLSTPFAAIHRKKTPPDGSLLENLHTETNSVDRKPPLVSFLSHLLVSNPPQKNKPSHLISHRLMMKHPPDRQLPADTSLTCGYLITSPVRGTSNSKRIVRNTCWTFGAAPENIIGFLVCSWKDRLTDTAE